MRVITNDQIFRAVEVLIGQHIVSFHAEANRYAFKLFASGEWHTLDMGFVDSAAVNVKLKSTIQ